MQYFEQSEVADKSYAARRDLGEGQGCAANPPSWHSDLGYLSEENVILADDIN
jgi:hypothetical protein